MPNRPNSVKAFRNANGWTVKEVVFRYKALRPSEGLDERTWLKWEAGQTPRLDRIETLCELFHAYPDQLGFIKLPAGLATMFDCRSIGQEVNVMQRRKFLEAAAAAVIVGTLDPTTPAAADATVTAADIEWLETSATDLHRVGNTQGGGNAISSAERILEIGNRWLQNNVPSDEWRKRLQVAAADISELAGWASYQTGETGKAKIYYDHSLKLASAAGAYGLAARNLNRSGRIELELGYPENALKYCELEEVAAKRTGNSHMVAASLTGQARAYAKLGNINQAQRFLRRSSDETTNGSEGSLNRYPAEQRIKAHRDQVYFDAEWGETLINTKGLTPQIAEQSIPYLKTATDNRTPDKALDHCVELAQLSQAYTATGEHKAALKTGIKAANLANRLTSNFADTYIKNMTKTAAPELKTHITNLTQ